MGEITSAPAENLWEQFAKMLIKILETDSACQHGDLFNKDQKDQAGIHPKEHKSVWKKNELNDIFDKEPFFF